MNLISKLFAEGKIQIIIGTKSLLGEGWDEPSINSLILASFVGSYMLSNQMRGRAIRVNENLRKTANVWHLVCVTEDEPIKKEAKKRNKNEKEKEETDELESTKENQSKETNNTEIKQNKDSKTKTNSKRKQVKKVNESKNKEKPKTKAKSNKKVIEDKTEKQS